MILSAYLGLFFGSFLASTLLPFPSEALLLASFGGGRDAIICLLVATAGNFLGGLTNYYIGYKCNNERLVKKLKFSEAKIARWEKRLSKWGAWLGFISWVPFIGDPLIVLLGFFRVKLLPLAATMLIGKFLRYAVITFAWLGTR